MKERKDLRDCHYGLYPAVTFAIIGLIVSGWFLEIELHSRRKEVVENYEHFFETYDWGSIVDSECLNYRREELQEPLRIIKSYAAQAFVVLSSDQQW